MLHFYFIIGDSLKYHNGHKFSTKDNDNDSYAKNCATMFKGGWWYNVCLSANLNGLYLNGTYYVHGTGMVWSKWKGYHYSFMKTKMMMRRN
jgi:ficolin